MLHVCLLSTHAAPDPRPAMTKSDQMMEIMAADVDQKIGAVSDETALSKGKALSDETALSEEIALLEETDRGVEVENDKAKLQYYQNNWDGVLSQRCPRGYGVYRIKSIHNNGK